MRVISSGRRRRCQRPGGGRREQNGSTRQPKPREPQGTRKLGPHDLWAFNPRVVAWFFCRASRRPNDGGPRPRPSRRNCRVQTSSSFRSNRRYLPSLRCGMVLVRVRSYSQLFGTRIRAAASSIVSHPMAWFVGVGTRVAAGAGVGAGCLPCVLESKRSGTRADWAPRSEAGELGIFFIPSIRATARGLMEVVIFRTRCGRSAREGGIPQGIHERSIRGSTGGRGDPESTREDSHEHTAEPIPGPIPR
jgi:hypothetical protein